MNDSIKPRTDLLCHRCGKVAVEVHGFYLCPDKACPGHGVATVPDRWQDRKRWLDVPSKNAADRGMELMLVKGKDLPPMATAYLKHLASRVGMCGEVCITAYTTYAWLGEGYTMKGVDDLYHPPATEIAHFDAARRELLAQGSPT